MGKEICHYYGAKPEDVWIEEDGCWLLVMYNGEERIELDGIESYSVQCTFDRYNKLENHDCILQITCIFLRQPEEHNFHFQPEHYEFVFNLYHQLSQILQSHERHGTSASS